jgi:hypothetical protein
MFESSLMCTATIIITTTTSHDGLDGPVKHLYQVLLSPYLCFSAYLYVFESTYILSVSLSPHFDIQRNLKLQCWLVV